ncbi:triphosphoribosyl-dephospho-CoA synthase [Escherichia coli]
MRRLLQLNQPVTPTTVCSTAASFCRGLTNRELRTNNSQLTAGQRLSTAGLTGARGEAEAGYPLVIDHACRHLPHSAGCGVPDPELALLNTLLLLIAINGDTNVAWAVGRGPALATDQGANIIAKRGIEPPANLDSVRQFDRECIEQMSLQAAVPTC